MPDLGTSVDQVTLVKWLKKEGDRVRRGEPICTVETDKAAVELESFAEGVLLRRIVAEGTVVEQGQVIAYVGQPGEAVPEPSAPPAEKRGPATAAPSTDVPEKPARGAPGRTSPLIRNLAEREGVDLAAAIGTGPGGRITRQDVLAAKAAEPQNPAAAAPPEGAEPLSPAQRAVARRVSQSHREIVPFNLTCRIEMAAAETARQRTQAELGRSVGWDSIFIHAVARVIGDFPNFRSHLVDGGRVVCDRINIAFLMGHKESLYSLVVADADRKDLAQVERDIVRLVFKVVRRKLTPEDSAGACFTVSNLSMYPIRSFTAVVPPDQSAILAVGGIEQTPLVRDGQVVVAPTATATLTVDHRLINGREAAQFLTRLKEVIETL